MVVGTVDLLIYIQKDISLLVLWRHEDLSENMGCVAVVGNIFERGWSAEAWWQE